MSMINNSNKLLVVVALTLLLHLTTWSWLEKASTLSTGSVDCLDDEEFIKIGCNPEMHLKMLDDVDFILGGVFPTSHLIGER